MFALEDGWARLHRKSVEKARKEFRVNDQRQWRPDKPNEAEGINLPGRCVYAQNEKYLELCNPGWANQRLVVFSLLIMIPFGLLIIWMWYGWTIHPLLFDEFITFWTVTPYRHDEDVQHIWMGWLVGFPLASGCAFGIFAAFYYGGARTSFFTYLRGRIRFNRITRKVYVLRPSYCGGNQWFEWDRLVALCDIRGNRKDGIGSLALYHPPFDANDPQAKGEDCLFVGPDLGSYGALGLWEYIRRYMEDGPTDDEIPAHATRTNKQMPLHLPQDYTTYCGEPSWSQYQLEVQPGFGETAWHMLSQITCSWPTFPKEWNSDSGVGEPEDRPVQTGAVMTAMLYRSLGRLDKADEVEFLKRWGTPEALAEAEARTY